MCLVCPSALSTLVLSLPVPWRLVVTWRVWSTGRMEWITIKNGMHWYRPSASSRREALGKSRFGKDKFSGQKRVTHYTGYPS